MIEILLSTTNFLLEHKCNTRLEYLSRNTKAVTLTGEGDEQSTNKQISNNVIAFIKIIALVL
jgi:hypothetical protein